MAVPKVVGIETEFGILHRHGGESNPVAASSMLINAYVNGYLSQRVGWDFEDEQPGADARGEDASEGLAPEVETHLVNAVLTNGARYYVDHAHPELSTPECSDARQCALYDRAGEEILIRSMAAANRLLPDGEEIIVHKNNSDGKGHSYGCHENYLMDRDVPFGRIVTHILPFFVTRQIFCGAGQVGVERKWAEHPDALRRDASDAELYGEAFARRPFQISQRADFFEEEVGLETTLKRPIVNTRDETHADIWKYRRFHVIVGDANMSELQTYLKVGATSLVLAMIDDDCMPEPPLTPAAGVAALRQVSRDPTLRSLIELADGRRMRALDIQWEYLGLARKYALSHGLEAVGGDDIGNDVLDRWEAVLDALETVPMSLASQLDWVAKLRLCEGFLARHGLEWGDPRLAALDLQYHDLRPERTLARRIGLERITTDAEIAAAVGSPPPTTRAWFRGRCLERFGDAIVAANWDSLVFDLGPVALRRVPMSEPLRGTQAQLGSLLDECADAAELVRRLGD